MAEILLEEPSPFGNIVAVVEDDDRTIYFYLHFPDVPEDDPQRMKVCWVRNRLPAPRDLNHAAMERGQSPLMPAAYCVDRGAGGPLDADALRVVWFEECDGSALLENDQPLAIIPSWSGMGDFSGYARDCVGEGPFAWELGADNVMHERIRAADDFWRLWDDEDFWEKWRDERIDAIEDVLGVHTKYYAIDGGEFPPRAMLRFDLPDKYVLITVGMSLFPQPSVERYYDDPSPYRRVELALALDRRCPEAELKGLGGYLSGQASFPWKQFTWLGEGHTIGCASTPQSCGGNTFAAMLLSPRLPNSPTVALPSFRGDPLNVLWMVPISQAEREFAQRHNSEALLQRLAGAGCDFVIRRRTPLKF